MTADELLDLIRHFVGGYLTLKATGQFDQALATSLRQSAIKIRRLGLGKLKDAAERLDDDELVDPQKMVDRLAKADSHFAELFQTTGVVAPASDAPAASVPPAAAPPPSMPAQEEDKLSLRGFFQDIAESYRQAQEELNLESIDYARNVPEGIPPSHFAIPSLKAEMEVGFERRKDSKVNLVFFGTQHSREQYGRSRINFEIVSAPPPPDPRILGIPPFLVVGHERNDLLTAFEGILKDSNQSSDFPLDKASTLVLRFRRSAYRSETAYLLVAIRETVGSATGRLVGACIVRDSHGDYRPADEIFTPRNLRVDKLVFVPRKDKLEAERSTALKKLEANLGDLLMSFSLALNDWISEGGPRYPAFLESVEERRSILEAAYKFPEIEQLSKLGSSSDYDLVLRRRVPDGWAQRRLVILRGDQNTPDDWGQLAVFGVVPTDTGWQIDKTFLRGAKNILRFGEAADDEERKQIILGAPDALLEARAAVGAWLELIRSGSVPE